jgi:RNA polymerase sigma-70 factor (ECF subfamily)
MSGSLDDAEDLVQETFLRAWGKLNSFDGNGSFRNWLYVISTRLWLDEARKRKKRILLPLDGDPADPDTPPQPPTSPASWLDPLPDSWLSGIGPSPEFSYERRETISLAFMAALQKLNARQRVVLLLREVFNWSAEDVSDSLGLTVDSVNNLLYRARKNLEPSAFEETPAPKQYLDQFVNAWESGDVPNLIKLLHEKATFAMPPLGVWYAGRESIQGALQNFVFMPKVKWKLIPTSANGNPAFGLYREAGESYQAFGLILPVFASDKILEVTSFLSPQLVARFGMPETMSF